MKLLLYCTKSNKKLFYDVVSQKYRYGLNGKNDKFNSLNGKIVAECDFEVEEIEKSFEDTLFTTKTLGGFALQSRSCLNANELYKYQPNYAIHIKNLHIFDEPKRLYLTNKDNENGDAIHNAPQNMMKCWFDGEKYILISIRPEWLCKILNGEKTIEVRKKVLKEMMQDG